MIKTALQIITFKLTVFSELRETDSKEPLFTGIETFHIGYFNIETRKPF